jgi:hypothetical protein
MFKLTLYQGNPDRNYKLWNINWEIYTPYVGAAGMLLHIEKKNKQETTTWNIRMEHNFIFAKWQIEQSFTIIGLVYRTHIEILIGTTSSGTSTERYILHM